MSAFLVDTRTIARILTWLTSEHEATRWVRCVLGEAYPWQAGWQTKLGHEMFDLNQLALQQRYGVKRRTLAYTFHPAPCSTVQAYKSLECWLYQCSEGNVPETKLYRVFHDEVRLVLASVIIAQLPEYQTAEWG